MFGVVASAFGADEAQAPPAPPGYKYQQVTPKVRLHQISPVEYFRTLLGMTPAQRQSVLANKSAGEREAILAKVHEYETMSADIREARLRQTELLWDIATMMRLPTDARAPRLKDLSQEDRAVVEDHLRRWDRLPAHVQKAFLEKESFISYYLRLQGSSAEEQKNIIDRLPPANREAWARELQRWQALPESEREELCDRFRQLFEVNDLQKREVINGFTDDERRQMESALDTYSQLTPDQRRQCVDSFAKFAVMTPPQRNEFLKNAERWQAMTAHERQVWRELVQKLPLLPPAPPGLDGQAPPLPPGLNLASPSGPPGIGAATDAVPVPLATTSQK